MSRRARVIIPGVAHHITQRGNNRQDVFHEEKDFSNYCFWVNEYSMLYRVSILAYCLMPNHVHFIIVPEDIEGVSRLFNTVHMRYAQYIHKNRGSSGHLWQGRFFSCVMDDRHLFFALRYVEQNPVRGGIVRYPWDYLWSSARYHVGISTFRYINIKKAPIMDHDQWKKYLINRDPDIDDQIRKKTFAGRALADEVFIEYWENKLGCLLRDLKRGRK